MTARAAALLVAALLVPAALSACADSAGAAEWDTAAVRAVARRVAASTGDRRLIILDRVSSPAGPELPWSVRQALTTAGFELSDSTALREAGARVLILDGSSRSDTLWHVDVRLHDTPDPALTGPVVLRWRVRCIGQACEAVDSAGRRTP